MDESSIAKLASNEVQDFISENELADENKLALKYKTLFSLPFALIAQQLVGKRKSKDKLPAWYNTREVVFPPTINLEQCSSQATAEFKARWMAMLSLKREAFVDLTGGLGVDTYFLSQVFQRGLMLEPNEELLLMAKHNHQLLYAQNVDYKSMTAEQFLKTDTAADLFYIDPSRRTGIKKVFMLGDCIPNVVELQAKLLAMSQFVLIKASPVLDIQQALRELSHVQAVAVLAIDNEVKELLFLQKKQFEGEPDISAVDISTHHQTQTDFVFKFSNERNLIAKPSVPQEFLYEPNPAILKAGAFKSACLHYGLNKIHPNTHLYTSEKLVNDFVGRIFKIEKLQPQANELNQWLPDGKANVITRNYPLSAEELKRKLKLKDGGDNYVIGFSEESRKTIVIATRIK